MLVTTAVKLLSRYAEVHRSLVGDRVVYKAFIRDGVVEMLATRDDYLVVGARYRLLDEGTDDGELIVKYLAGLQNAGLGLKQLIRYAMSKRGCVYFVPAYYMNFYIELDRYLQPSLEIAGFGGNSPWVKFLKPDPELLAMVDAYIDEQDLDILAPLIDRLCELNPEFEVYVPYVQEKVMR